MAAYGAEPAEHKTEDVLARVLCRLLSLRKILSPLLNGRYAWRRDVI